MNKLDVKIRAMNLNMMVEGMSMRSISHTIGVSINTVTMLLVDAGEACAKKKIILNFLIGNSS